MQVTTPILFTSRLNRRVSLLQKYRQHVASTECAKPVATNILTGALCFNSLFNVQMFGKTCSCYSSVYLKKGECPVLKTFLVNKTSVFSKNHKSESSHHDMMSQKLIVTVFLRGSLSSLSKVVASKTKQIIDLTKSFHKHTVTHSYIHTEPQVI